MPSDVVFNCLLCVQMGWGSNDKGQLGVPAGLYTEVHSPKRIHGFDGQRLTCISAGAKHSAAVQEGGVVVTWGHGRCAWLWTRQSCFQEVCVCVLCCLQTAKPCDMQVAVCFGCQRFLHWPSGRGDLRLQQQQRRLLMGCKLLCAAHPQIRPLGCWRHSGHPAAFGRGGAARLLCGTSGMWHSSHAGPYSRWQGVCMRVSCRRCLRHMFRTC